MVGNYTARSHPGIGNDGKIVYVQTPEYLVGLESSTGKVLGQVRSGHEGREFLSPSPDGSKLAGAGNGIVKVWDLATGRLNAHFAASPIDRSPRFIYWLNGEQILIDASVEPAFASLPSTMLDLIDLKTQALVGAYHSDVPFPSNRVGNKPLMYARDNRNPKQVKLSTPTLPHGELASKIVGYSSRFELDMKPGSRVSIELDSAPEFDREKSSTT